MTRQIAFICGLLLAGIGLIGIVVPLLPTTIFFILAAGCFARSSPALEKRLLDHPRFGPSIRLWRDHGVIPVRAKFYALTGIAIGFALYLWRMQPTTGWAIAVFAVMALIAWYVVSRPSAPNEPPSGNGVTP